MTSWFLSYSRTDMHAASSVKDILEGGGQDIWFDNNDIHIGQSWQEQISAGINGSEALLLLVSSASIRSPYVRVEWERAQERGIPIVLLIWEATPLPPDLKRLPWVDLRPDFEAAVEQARQYIAEGVPHVGEPPPDKGIVLPPRIKRFWRWGQLYMWLHTLLVLPVLVYALFQSSVGLLILLGFVFGAVIPGEVRLTWVAFRRLRRRQHRLFRLLLRGLIYLAFDTSIIVLSLLVMPLFSFIWLPLLLPGVWMITVMMSEDMYRWSPAAGYPRMQVMKWRWWWWLVPTVPLTVGFGAYALADPDVTSESALVLIVAFFLLLGALLTGVGVARAAWKRMERRLNRLNAPEAGPSTRVAVEYAPQDAGWGQTVERFAQRYHEVVPVSEAKVVVTLVSQYQTTTAAQIGRQVVVPVRLDNVDLGGQVDPALRSVHIMDWRTGPSPRDVDAFVRLLATPEHITQHLENVPIQGGKALPGMVNGLRLAYRTMWAVALLLLLLDLESVTSQRTLSDDVQAGIQYAIDDTETTDPDYLVSDYTVAWAATASLNDNGWCVVVSPNGTFFGDVSLETGLVGGGYPWRTRDVVMVYPADGGWDYYWFEWGYIFSCDQFEPVASDETLPGTVAYGIMAFLLVLGWFGGSLLRRRSRWFVPMLIVLTLGSAITFVVTEYTSWYLLMALGFGAMLLATLTLRSVRVWLPSPWR